MQTGIQLITLPYVHYNPAKPAHIDQDTGIFPYKEPEYVLMLRKVFQKNPETVIHSAL